jgi:hypothetical protein
MESQILIWPRLGVLFWLQERAALTVSDPHRYANKDNQIVAYYNTNFFFFFSFFAYVVQ